MLFLRGEEPLVASLLLVAMPGAPSFLFLVVRPGAPSSVLSCRGWGAVFQDLLDATVSFFDVELLALFVAMPSCYYIFNEINGKIIAFWKSNEQSPKSWEKRLP